MKPISDVTCCVVDCGLFLPMAFRMAEECKRVLYHNPDRPAFPTLKKGSIGDGFTEVEVVDSYLQHMKEIDLFCFPDVGRGDDQVYLEEQGKLVWGSKTGEILELDRIHFMETIGELGLDVPPFEVVTGVTALRDYLKDEEDQYIKVSKWRGDFETTHWRDWKKDNGWLDWLAVNFGPLKEHIEFLVFPSIPTDLEIGGDSYNVWGQWPDTMINGLEWKDKSYFAAVTPVELMPEQTLSVFEALSPVLAKHKYANQFCVEVRVKDDKAYPIDATTRGGMPSTASQHKLWKNFPEIVYHGAAGEMVEPEPEAMFSIECMITSKCGKDNWEEVDIDPDIEDWCRLSYCCKVDGVYCFPPDELHHGELGWLCAIGDTPEETLEAIKGLADKLPDGLDADVEALAGVIKEIDSAREQGIPFTNKPVPPAASVIED